MSECRCGRPTRDDRTVCGDCVKSLEQALAEVPWTVEELDVTRSGEKAAQSSGSTSASAEKPLPIHEGALDAYRTLQAVLVSWVRYCDEEQVRGGRPGLPENNLPAMSRWLLLRVDGLSLNELGPDAVDEITDAIAAAHRLIDIPAESRYMGECQECGNRMWVRDGKATVKCSKCGSEWAAEDCRARLDDAARLQINDRIYTASEMAVVICAFGLADDPVALADRIRKWAAPRGDKPPKLLAKAHLRRDDQRTRPAYRYGDVVALLVQARERRGKRAA